MPNHTAECHECGTRRLKSNMYKLELYNTPFDDTPYTAYVCKETPQTVKKGLGRSWMESCEELLTDTSWADFRFFECADCRRTICEQNPRNGWHTQSRWIEDEQICLRCYEQHLLENGVSLESLENGTLPGMFLNDNELRDAGFVLMLDNYKVSGKKNAEIVCNRGIQWIKEGKIVIVNYERMSIIGDEGYISLWTKTKKDEE